MTQPITRPLERQVSAPKSLKSQTFTKIAQLNVMLELASFFSSVPQTLLDSQSDKSIKSR